MKSDGLEATGEDYARERSSRRTDSPSRARRRCRPTGPFPHREDGADSVATSSEGSVARPASLFGGMGSAEGSVGGSGGGPHRRRLSVAARAPPRVHGRSERRRLQPAGLRRVTGGSGPSSIMSTGAGTSPFTVPDSWSVIRSCGSPIRCRSSPMSASSNRRSSRPSLSSVSPPGVSRVAPGSGPTRAKWRPSGCGSRGVTMHGFALNLDPDMAFFGQMNPCGITDRPVTSLTLLTGRKVSLEEVIDLVIPRSPRCSVTNAARSNSVPSPGARARSPIRGGPTARGRNLLSRSGGRRSRS